MTEVGVRYRCAKCDAQADVTVAAGAEVLACPSCGSRVRAPEGAWDDGRPLRCLVCPCRELFCRRDFNPRLGVFIVAAGFVFSTIAWGFHRPLIAYAILFASAALDMLFFFMVGDVVQCYRCGAEYRGLDPAHYEPFELETHERFRQERARVAGARAAGESMPAP